MAGGASPRVSSSLQTANEKCASQVAKSSLYLFTVRLKSPPVGFLKHTPPAIYWSILQNRKKAETATHSIESAANIRKSDRPHTTHSVQQKVTERRDRENVTKREADFREPSETMGCLHHVNVRAYIMLTCVVCFLPENHFS